MLVCNTLIHRFKSGLRLSKKPGRLMFPGFFFCLSRKFRSLLNKTLRGMRARAKWIFVAKATALGATVPQAELFILVRIYKKQDENKVDAITAL